VREGEGAQHCRDRLSALSQSTRALCVGGRRIDQPWLDAVLGAEKYGDDVLGDVLRRHLRDVRFVPQLGDLAPQALLYVVDQLVRSRAESMRGTGQETGRLSAVKSTLTTLRRTGGPRSLSWPHPAAQCPGGARPH
jgi:hypothetical protein